MQTIAEDLPCLGKLYLQGFSNTAPYTALLIYRTMKFTRLFLFGEYGGAHVILEALRNNAPVTAAHIGKTTRQGRPELVVKIARHIGMLSALKNERLD